ncbi:alpha/beta hydrolase fold family protein [Escherichia coli DEC14B]|nr:alpha/beta hydrolase fold family protein [Escherichia coli DEC14B]
MKITDHKLSEGIALTFRVPEGNIKHPLIILCHGFCGIRNVLLPCFANAFTEAGFATITFDYRGFGESDGERGRLVPAMQTEDIISVINWAEKQECIDNQRIGLWGTSLGGGHVFSAAAQDQRVKCIVSQLAFADGDVLVTGEMNESERASFLSTLNKMAEKKKNTGKEMFVGVTRVLSDDESKVFFEKIKARHPEMDIKIPFLRSWKRCQYKTGRECSQRPVPSFGVIAGQDSVNPRNREEHYMMLLLLVLRNYTRKLMHAIMIFMRARFLNV